MGNLALLGSLILLMQAPADPKPTVKLHADRTAAVPGSTVQVAVALDVPKPWHFYHPIILDTGFATTIDFITPAGVRIDNVRWPSPQYEERQGIKSLEFGGPTTVLADLHVDASVAAGTNLEISAEMKALACIEQCVPIEGRGTFALPVVAQVTQAANEKLFAEAIGKMPPPLADAPYIKGSTLALAKDTLSIGEETELIATIRVQKDHHIQDRDPGSDALVGSRLFIEARDGLMLVEEDKQIWPEAHVRNLPGIGKVREQAGEVKIRVPFRITDEKFPSGPVTLRVLFRYQCCTDTGQCFPPAMAEGFIRFTAKTPNPPASGAEIAAVPPSTPETKTDKPAAAARTPAKDGLSLPLALLLGFLGGLVLNIMPCVLPVISIKIVSFIQQAGEDHGRILRLGLAFTAGVMLWFWLLAGITGLGSLSVRSSFQNPLQNSAVVLSLGAVMFLMALNLFGVFEFVLPGQAAGKLDEATRREGYGGAFVKGFLATLLGTACTAPLLAPAMAYAFTQPFGVSLLVFTAAGLGMASPYLALSAHPGWLRFVPKPGMWMVTFKQAMGFVLLATVIWLLWVLRKHWGPDGVVATLAFFTFLGFAAWMVGKLRITTPPAKKSLVWLSALAICAGGYYVSYQRIYDGRAAHVVTTPIGREINDDDVNALVRTVRASDWSDIPWIPYRPGLADSLAKRGYSVYVDYTADWCATCKTNLFVVLQTEGIRKQMKQLGVIPIEADFTGNDPDMRRDIESDGRLSVPVNRVYPAGRPQDYILLPVVLTPSSVSEALEQAGPSRTEVVLGDRPR